MNVGELLRERDRLLGLLDEAQSARAKLKQVNVLIALYGDSPDVELVSGNGHAARATCDECGAGPFNERGLNTHRRRMHGTETPKQRAAQSAKARAARKGAK